MLYLKCTVLHHFNKCSYTYTHTKTNDRKHPSFSTTNCLCLKGQSTIVRDPWASWEFFLLNKGQLNSILSFQGSGRQILDLNWVRLTWKANKWNTEQPFICLTRSYTSSWKKDFSVYVCPMSGTPLTLLPWSHQEWNWLWKLYWSRIGALHPSENEGKSLSWPKPVFEIILKCHEVVTNIRK